MKHYDPGFDVYYNYFIIKKPIQTKCNYTKNRIFFYFYFVIGLPTSYIVLNNSIDNYL